MGFCSQMESEPNIVNIEQCAYIELTSTTKEAFSYFQHTFPTGVQMFIFHKFWRKKSRFQSCRSQEEDMSILKIALGFWLGFHLECIYFFSLLSYCISEWNLSSKKLGFYVQCRVECQLDFVFSLCVLCILNNYNHTCKQWT